MIYQDQYDCRQWQGSTKTGVDADGIGSVSESDPKCQPRVLFTWEQFANAAVNDCCAWFEGHVRR